MFQVDRAKSAVKPAALANIAKALSGILGYWFFLS